MIVLDTNVISELMRPHPDSRVVAWVDEQTSSEVFLTAVTTAELRYGVARLPVGQRKNDLADRIGQMLEEDFGGRVLPFDDEAAAHFAEIAVNCEWRGAPIGTADAQIAAICRNHSADLATRNTKDFAHTGVLVVNPWDDPRSGDGPTRR